VPTSFVREMRDIVQVCVALQTRRQRKDPGLDFSNYFKRDDLARVAYRHVCGNTRIRRIAGTIRRAFVQA